MDCSMLASLSFTISWSLLKPMSTESMMPSNHLCCSFSSCPQSFPASGSFPMSWLLTSGGQRIRALASASVLPINIQSWFPLGLTSLISLLSKGLSRVLSSTVVWKHQFFGAQPLCGPTLTSIHDYWKNHTFDYMDLCWKIYVTLHIYVQLSFSCNSTKRKNSRQIKCKSKYDNLAVFFIKPDINEICRNLMWCQSSH